MPRTFVIAEPGGTAEGDFDAMCELIRVASECGADVWKPQWVSSAERHLQRRTARLTPEETAQFRAKYAKPYSWLQWPFEWHREFIDRCHAVGMRYAVSVCLPEDVPSLVDADYLKVSSFEATDCRMMEAVKDIGRSGPTFIVSCGMGADAYEWYLVNRRVLRLHCVSAYPAPLEQLDLKRLCRVFSGFSDHTKDTRTGMVAVAAGARVIEAHYRLDDCDPKNPDYAVAFSPAEFAQYIRNIRDAELMLGDGMKRIQPCEEPMLKYKVGS